MCRCNKCECDTMEIYGEPTIVDWGYGWDNADIQQIMWFHISIPYKCTECGFEEEEKIAVSNCE